MSSNDFDGPYFGPDGSRGADEQGAGAPQAGEQAAGGQGAGGQSAGNEGHGPGGRPRYPAPEGWGNDGFWRDSSIDSDYETTRQPPVRPAADPRETPGYSYWADGRGWENSPGAPGGPGSAGGPGAPGARPGQTPSAPATSSFDPNARAAFLASAAGVPGAGSEPTGVYGGAPGVPGGYGGPAGPGAGVPGGYGPGGYGVPPGPGGPGVPLGPGGPVGPGGPSRPGGPTGPGGRGGKRKGSWWRHWTWKKALAVVGGTCVFFVLCLFSAYEYLSSTATIPAALASANYQDTTVYYSDGKTVLGTIGETNRQDLTFNEIPKQLQNAVIAAENKNFWTEGGISPTGILRAAIHDVTSGGGDLNGGSTITQEFVRGYYDGVGTQQTASRKIKEIFIAQKLANDKSKQWILTNYLNLIYLGENSYGVSAAAQTYFHESVSQLTVAQDAVLAGIIQQPSTYPLPANRAALTARWQYVIQQMVADKYITAAQAATMKFPTLLTDKDGAASGGASINSSNSPWAPYLMAQVENELTATGPDGDNVSPQELETGGLKVVTTISLSMEKEIYNAVGTTLTSANIESTGDNSVDSLPPWALVGAELQDPKTGEVIAEYPGKGQTMTAKGVCATPDCQDNTAAYTREQVGSSFKPYVLATAVSQGMNVKTSTLDTSPYQCIAPDSPVTYSTPISLGTYSLPGLNNGCSLAGAEKVENDGGELIGKPAGTASTGVTAYADNVQDALAQSSNTGFSDLAHRVGTANIYTMAGKFGVNLAPYGGPDGGSGLSSYIGDSGMALGIAPLTVNEQTTMLATIADDGQYHQAHIVKYWQQGDGTEQPSKVDQYSVLTPSQDAQVQYAMEQTTIDGTAEQYVTFGQQTPGTVIGKTGTTSSSHAGFFIGSTTQYTLVVGMFTISQAESYPNNLSMLGGGGFGGYWPAKVWNAFAEAEFSSTPTLFPTNPAFSGSTWNLLGPITKPKPTVTCTVDGKKKKISGKTCPSQTPTPTCSYQGENNCTTPTASATPTPTCSYTGESQFQDCVTASASAAPTPTCSYTGESQFQDCVTATASASASATCASATGVVSSCNGTNASSTPTATGAQAGLAVGGVLAVLPGSLLWVTVSQRRRRRRRRAGRAE